MKKNKSQKAHIRWGLYILFGVLNLIMSASFVGCTWYKANYNIEFKELLYTLVSPLTGTGNSVISDVLNACLPPICLWMAVYALVAFLLAQRRVDVWVQLRVGKRTTRFEAKKLLRKLGAVLCVIGFVLSLVYAVFSFRIPAYVKALLDRTTIYEDYYVDPLSVDISSEGRPKNLIYIYLESMETTYASTEEGGKQAVNYIPNLTALAEEHDSFSDKTGQLGGFHNTDGTGWTMGSLFATTSGIPFSFPVEENSMWQRAGFAPKLTCLGDVLEQKGYNQEFLCGSVSGFGGRRSYFTQHGNYRIFDLFTAREEKFIAEDYLVWWGFEDKILYEIAKDQVLKLASQDQPFNLTMITADTHFNDGYFCDLCREEYGTLAANVVACADRQLLNFVNWCKEQDFYEDTVIVIVGDHPRMDEALVQGIDYYERTVYNCFINASQKTAPVTEGRVFTPMDVFPTVLSAMGFEIEGDRLGLGTDLYSRQPTLAEEYSYDWLNEEIKKYSVYYVENFS